MRVQCKCKLPYVQHLDTCQICFGEQSRFIQRNPCSVKREFKGNEFKAGDIVEVIHEGYQCLVEILEYIPNGWYRVILPNGGIHETQILGQKVN